MRTKTLLLTAALSAAGIASSMAQVYSVNAVGYVNTDLAPGFNLISNPLDAQDNSIAALFAGVPDGTQVYKFNGTVFVTATYDELAGSFVPAAAAEQTVVPGEGVFVRNPTAAAIQVTFVGEVPQGTLTTDLNPGLQIVSSKVPQAGTADELGYVGVDGDQIYQFNEQTQQYATSTYDELLGGWAPALGTLDVGEAFFLRKLADGTWTREFSVNDTAGQ